MSVSRLCERLVKSGATVTVFTTTANGPTELPVAENQLMNIDGVDVIYFKRLTKDHTHFSPTLLIRLWKEVKNYDLVHIHAWWNLVSVFACSISLMRGVPVVVSPRGTLSSYSFSNKNVGIKSFIHQFLGKPLLNRCNIHVTSERERLSMIDLIKPKNITVIPNLVKLPGYDPAKGRRETGSCLKLIFLSRIDEKKGIDLLLHALAQVTIPYFLTIAGSGGEVYINYLKEIAATHHITDKINWAGFHMENKFEMLRDNDLFILPSHDENFGNAIIESLSVGTAVLITPHVGLADYVIKNKLGWLCETNTNAISSVINTIGNKYKTQLDRIREQAPGIIYKDFDPGNLVPQYLSMYKSTTKYE
jgi:glycosyltransferase involved in cell wall biosynthesis